MENSYFPENNRKYNEGRKYIKKSFIAEKNKEKELKHLQKKKNTADYKIDILRWSHIFIVVEDVYCLLEYFIV